MASATVRVGARQDVALAGAPRSSARRWPSAQSAMSTSDIRESTTSFSRPLRASIRIFAVPRVRPGPCTEAGFTLTRSTPTSAAVAKATRSASNFERS